LGCIAAQWVKHSLCGLSWQKIGPFQKKIDIQSPHWQSCQVSRFTRESPGFRADLQVSRLVLKISRILTKIQLAKILSVLSKENPYVFVKWEIKKRKSPQFVVQIKVFVQYSCKNWAILAHEKPKSEKVRSLLFK
jgi:hypothetical protein